MDSRRWAARSATAGAISGVLVGGVGSRIAMRVSTLMGGFSDSSVGETLAYVGVMGVLGALVGAGLGAAVRRYWLPWWGVGLFTTVLVFAAVRLEGNWPALFTEGNPTVNLVLWALVGFGFGALWYRIARPGSS